MRHALVLVAGLLVAGCAAPPDSPAAQTRPTAVSVEHFGCSLQIGFFGLPEEEVRSRLPDGFEPVLQQDAAGRSSARSFVVAYGCAGAAVGGVRANESVAEMGFALAVEPPAALRGDASSHWIATWITGSPAVAAAYASWGLGRAGDVTHVRPAVGEAGEYRAAASADGGSYSLTSRNTPGFVDLGEDTLRLFSVVDGAVASTVDLVVEPTRGGTGIVTYSSDDGSFYPATSLTDQGFHESWTDRAWTFTYVEV